MKIPTVALVGKPNVGKSTLFNRLAGKRISIIEDTPGVTRDRIYSKAMFNDKPFYLIDTGGIDLSDGDFNEEIKDGLNMFEMFNYRIENQKDIIAVYSNNGESWDEVLYLSYENAL